MTSCPDDEVLAGFVAGTLRSEERLVVADHAATCTHCHFIVRDVDVETKTEDDGPAPAGADLEQIGRYLIKRRIGAGGMGIVYEARDPELGRDVAIKLLRSTASQDRLRREAQALAKLSHPNVVGVYDVGVHLGQTFVAMALVDGVDLRRWIMEPRTIEETLRVVRAAGRGLAAAHAVGLIHRDLKPDNIFVARDGQVLVGDFGLARDAISEAEPAAPLDRVVGNVTATGMVLGTPAYMAPEQARGAATAACDQFSFCVTAWELLHGARPFAGFTLDEIHEHVRRGELAAASSRRIAPAIQRALVRGLAFDPEERHPSLEALLAALTPARPRRWPWLAGAGAVVAIAAIVVLASRGSKAPRCRTADDRLAGTWDEPVRDRVQAQLSTVLDVEIATPIVVAFDEHVARWRMRWDEACTAPEQSSTMFDLRIACLERSRSEFQGAAALLAAGDVSVARKAFEVIRALGSPDRCADISTLSRIAPPPPDRAAAVATVDAALSRVTVLIAAGKYKEAHDQGMRVVADARRLDYPPLLARALLTAGTTVRFDKTTAAGIALLREATTTALAAGDDVLVASALIELASMLAVTGKLDETEQQLALAAAAVARVGDRARFEINLKGVQMNVAALRGNFDEVLRLVDAALLLVVAAGDPIDESETRQTRARTLASLGRNEEAIAEQERALKRVVSAVGKRGTLAVIADHGLAAYRVQADPTPAAVAELERTYRALVAALGESSYDVAQAGLRLTKTWLDLDDLEHAGPLAASTANVFETVAGPVAGATLDTRLQGALIAIRLGRFDEAERTLDDAAAKMAAARGELNIALTPFQFGRAELYLAQHRPADAAAALDRASAILATGGPAWARATVSLWRAEVALARHAPAEALAALRTAEPEISGGDESRLLVARVEAMWAVGDREGAATAAMAATTALKASPNRGLAARLRTWLAAHPAKSP